MAYKTNVHRQTNVGKIGVPCFGCGLHIGRHDYLMIQSPVGVYLLHEDCATLLSEGMDDALDEQDRPVIPEDDYERSGLVGG